MKLSQAKAALRKRVAEQKAKAFLGMCREAGLPEPMSEFCFSPPRRWRFDWSWSVITAGRLQLVALEVEGGAYVQGRHTRGAGFVKDLEKYNRATVLGWRILRVTPQQLCTKETLAMLKALLT